MQTWTVNATFEGGVLRLATRLPLAEGEQVTVTVGPARPPLVLGQPDGKVAAASSSEPSPEALAAEERVRNAKTHEEFMAACAEAAKYVTEDYDAVLEGLNENRRRSGQRLLYLPERKGIDW